jgi:agmatinase
MINDAGDMRIGEYFDIEQQTLDNLAPRLPLLSLGGDHSITFPVLRAFHQVYGPLDILHLDAHSDLYDSFEGDSYSHARPFARIMEQGLCSRLVQVGIRSITKHQQEQAERFGVTVISMNQVLRVAIPRFEKPIYISLDMDVLDPAYAPGVSHHEPGGLSTRELLTIIRGLNVPIVGADIVEYNPKRDLNSMTAMVCAKIFKELAAKMLVNHE